ncbi:MAG: hypothetical protein INQ03_13700 [Candidatus Heimdallarchaeota archaeon]|nr:hypothetical protein [Candidatus Heimdallarchaeota archaeon]
MELLQGWYFLTYQQVYQPPNLLLNRSKTVKIEITGLSEVFDTVIAKIQPILPLWETDPRQCISKLCELFRVSMEEIVEALKTNYMLDPFNRSSWDNMGFNEEQVYMFIISEIWKTFYKRRVDAAKSKLDLSKWVNQNVAASKLAHEYSWLNNLIYVKELSIFFNLSSEIFDPYISTYVPLFEAHNLEEYVKKIKEMSS